MTRQGGRIQHIDSYAYATAPSQWGLSEQRRSAIMEHCCRDHWRRRTCSVLFFSTVSHLRKKSSIPFRDNACIFVDCVSAHWLAVSTHRYRMSSSAVEMDFYCFRKQYSISMTVRRLFFEGADALQQQGLPLTDRPVQVSSVKTLQTLMGLFASLYSWQMHSLSEKLSWVVFCSRSSLLNSLYYLQCSCCYTEAPQSPLLFIKVMRFHAGFHVCFTL